VGEVSVSWRAMASPVIWTVYGDFSEEAGRILQAVGQQVAAAFAAWEAVLSRFRETSELTALNRRLDEWVTVSPVLYDAVSTAHRAWRKTGGTFDPTVLENLVRLGYGPSLHATGGSRAREWLRRQPRRHRLRIRRPLDLGGIGKGLAVRWGMRMTAKLCAAGLVRPGAWCLNAGGDLALAGALEGDDFRIGIEDPGQPEQLLAVIRVDSPGAVATSSIARRRWRHGRETVHHLIDPRTGRPGGQGLLAVTVCHRDPAWAEVWSKSLFLQGADNIGGVAERLGHPVWWVTDDGRLNLSASAARATVWTREPFRVSGRRAP
jgi:thiamine biosynthesis lipoprotein